MTIKPYPVAELVNTNFTDRFQLWVKQFGLFRLARSLEVDVRTVSRWFDLSRRPEVKTAKKIIALSAIEPLDGRPLSFEDIYGQAQVSNIEVRQVKKVQAWE